MLKALLALVIVVVLVVIAVKVNSRPKDVSSSSSSQTTEQAAKTEDSLRARFNVAAKEISVTNLCDYDPNGDEQQEKWKPTGTSSRQVPAASSTPKPAAKPAVPQPSLREKKVVKFEMSGMRIGDRLTQDFAYSNCPAKDAGKPEIMCHNVLRLGEGEDKEVWVFYHFKDQKLIAVSLSYKSELFSVLVQSYTQKFGIPPQHAKTEEVVTGIGARHTNQIVSWDTDAGPFILKLYGNSITDGYGVLLTPEYKQSLKEQKSAQVNQLAKKLDEPAHARKPDEEPAHARKPDLRRIIADVECTE